MNRIALDQFAPLQSGLSRFDALNQRSEADYASFERMITTAAARQAAAQHGEQDEIRLAAEQLVSTTLIQPLLAQMRNDPFRADLFHGGFGEDAFAQQLDTILADRITQRTDFAIVNAVQKHLTKQGVANQTAPETHGGRLNIHG